MKYLNIKYSHFNFYPYYYYYLYYQYFLSYHPVITVVLSVCDFKFASSLNNIAIYKNRENHWTWVTWPCKPTKPVVEWLAVESEVTVQIPWLDSYFYNRTQFSITSGQGWWRPMLCTVNWVKKSHTVESYTWPLNSHNCSENYTKTKTFMLQIFTKHYWHIFCSSNTFFIEWDPPYWTLM